MLFSTVKFPMNNTCTRKFVSAFTNRQFIHYNRCFCSKNDNEINDPKSEKKYDSSAENASKDELHQSTNAKSKESRTRISKPAISEDPKEAGKKRLEALLSQIKVESSVSQDSHFKLNLARPLKRISKKERFPPVEKISPDQEIKLAAKAVASTFGEDSEKIEAELNSKLSFVSESKESEFVEVSDEEKSDHLINTEMSKNIMSSVKDVASEMHESSAPPKSKLIQKLMKLSNDDKMSPKESMLNLVEGMKVQTQKDLKQRRVLEDPKLSMKPKQVPSRLPFKKMDLFGFSPLNIFTLSTDTKTETTNTIWQACQNKELKLLVQFAPSSAFEEMIMWTEEGKHWKFPIDNEIDIGPEANVGFHEHVFLEQHLKGFPTKGPIRHFMELVVVGLSKNPYITVDRKIENINWYRDYFKEKEELLRDSGAIY